MAVLDARKQLAHEFAGGGLTHRLGAAIDDLVEELASTRHLHEDEVEVRLSRALPAVAMAE